MVSYLKRRKHKVFSCLLVLFLVANTPLLAADKKISVALSHYIMAMVYDKWGDIDEAVREYKQALKADPKNVAIHLNLAAAYIKNNSNDKAVEELKLTVALEPEAPEPHAILALLYSLEDKADLATQEYEIALKNASLREPANIDLYKGLAELYLRQKKFSAAEDVYKLILDLSPGDAGAHFYLGNIYDELKEPDKVEEELKKAIALNPDYAEALNYLGYLYTEAGKNLDQAEAMIKRALQIESDNGAYIDSLGWLYFKQGKLKEAIKELERAAGLLQDPVIYDHLGDVYFKNQDLEKANINWQKSLELNPDQEAVKNKIEGLK